MRLPFRDKRADWVKVLDTMYAKQLSESLRKFDREEKWVKNAWEGEPKPKIEKQYLGIDVNSDEIKKEIELTAEDKIEVMRYLSDMNLVSALGEGHPSLYPSQSVYRFTQEGLQLAHQIKTERQRRKTNRRLLYLTAVITILTAFLIGIEFIEVPTYSL